MVSTIGSPNNTAPAVITNVQALRGIAALFVLIAHIAGAEIAYGGGNQILAPFFRLGETGVDLFFMISGFIMVKITRAQDTLTSTQFLARRAIRVYPLYWIATSVLVILYIGKQVIFGESTNISNLFASLLLWPQERLPVLPVGWTLEHEMYFYVVFAGILALPANWFVRSFFIWAALIGAGMALGLGQFHSVLALIVDPLTFQFLIGVAIALFLERGRTVAIPGTMILAAGIIWLFAIFLFWADTLYPDGLTNHTARVLVFTGPWALILLGALQIEQQGIIAPNWLRYCGDISYSLYLFHLPVVLIVGRLIATRTGSGLIDNIVLIFVSFMASLVCSALIHRYVEKHLLAIGHKFIRRQI